MSLKPTANSSADVTDISFATASTAIPQSSAREIIATAVVEARENSTDIGHPQEQMEVEEPQTQEESLIHPSGAKLWLTYTCLCIAMLLHGLDLAIVAVAVPRLTDQFHTVEDLGWYSAAYPLVAASTVIFFGKCYTVFKTKHVYIFGLITFETGSLLCTLAPSSKAFVVGRAIAGLGAGAFSSGMTKILKGLFPLSRQALYGGIIGACQSVGLVMAPSVGGLLVDTFTWRGCFGVNLPLGVLCIAFTMWAFEETHDKPEVSLPFKEKLKRLDLVGTVLVIPSIACLLLGLQWGGIKYGWSNWRIILLFAVFGILFSAFGYLQYRLKDEAAIPIRILRQRNILAAMWLCICTNGILGMTEYYISIYFQGVRGYTPTKSGLFGLPMLVGLLVATLLAASATTIIGYFYPFMFGTSILAPVASGLLTTIDLDGTPIKPVALLGFLGFSVGLSMGAPMLAVQMTSTSKDVSIATAITFFGSGVGSAIWMCVSATLFQNRLTSEINNHSPGTNITSLEQLGLSDIRKTIGADKLKGVLFGYNEAVVQTLYLPLALTVLTLVSSLTVERRSIKKKTE